MKKNRLFSFLRLGFMSISPIVLANPLACKSVNQPSQLSTNKGGIVAYHPDYRDTPTNEQLDLLTHLILFSVTPANHDVPLPDGWGSNWPSNIDDVVNRAHDRGVKVIIALGGWEKTGSFPESVKPANRQIFVNNIIKLVDRYNFDGVDIDWEYPVTNEEVANFEGFMVALKEALGNKRLSFAIGAQYQPNKYTDATYNALDALHIMTYDNDWDNGRHHADVAWSKGVVNRWVNSKKIAKEKIFFGVPFYGRKSGGEDSYANIIQGAEAARSQTNSANGCRYDGIPQIKEKTKYAWEKDIGGIMIWETGQDVEATSQYSLLRAVYKETRRLKGQQR